jgi:hypothetical protein
LPLPRGEDGQAGYGQFWRIIDGNKTQVYDGLALDRDEWQDIANGFFADAEAFRQKAVSSIQLPLGQALDSWQRAADAIT